MNAFNLIIIGDEILHGSRQDKHFAFFKSLLESHGLKLNQVQYLPDEPDLLVKQLRRSFSDGLPTFVTGGIGSTPDDHTRQAAAAALDLPVVRHPEAAKFIEGVTRKRGEPLDSPEHAQRLKMADFPEGAELVPNPFNNIAGFSIREHYFFPGFPVMAHPMAEWVLETYYADRFNQTDAAAAACMCSTNPNRALRRLWNILSVPTPVSVRTACPPWAVPIQTAVTLRRILSSVSRRKARPAACWMWRGKMRCRVCRRLARL